MKTLSTVISENCYNQDSLQEIISIVNNVASEKGLKVIVNNQGAIFWSKNEKEEDLVVEARKEIMAQLSNIGY